MDDETLKFFGRFIWEGGLGYLTGIGVGFVSKKARSVFSEKTAPAVFAKIGIGTSVTAVSDILERIIYNTPAYEVVDGDISMISGFTGGHFTGEYLADHLSWK